MAPRTRARKRAADRRLNETAPPRLGGPFAFSTGGEQGAAASYRDPLGVRDPHRPPPPRRQSRATAATPMQLNHQKSERKPHPRRRGGHDNPQPGGPRRGNAGSAKPTPATRFAVYSGQERLGSYGQAGDAWVAFTRLGREIGTFASQNEAIVAIERGAKS
jgi:hypothetical protein